jgi:hypothetical protein
MVPIVEMLIWRGFQRTATKQFLPKRESLSSLRQVNCMRQAICCIRLNGSFRQLFLVL